MSERSSPNGASAYLEAAARILERIGETQLEALEKAADLCSRSILEGGLVHLFGTGHSRIPVEEIFPRHGSFPGFHPIVELSLTYHNPVVGPNGQRQAMFLEQVEGFAEVILRNFVLESPDSFLLFSNGGVNEVVVEMALEAKQRALPVMAVVSLEHCRAARPRHRSGLRLPDVADLTIDNCTPGGDALVSVEGLEDPVGPGSTIGAAAVANALKCLVAERLTRAGRPPLVLTSAYFIGAERSARRFQECYDEYRRHVGSAYGWGREERPESGKKR